MTTAYVLIFLTLFAIIGDNLVQKYLHYKINDHYSRPHYEIFVHRRRPNMNSGLSMRALVNKDSNTCQIFLNLVHDVYEKAPFHYKGMEQDLLTLFQKNITFDKKEALEKKHYYQSRRDLETLDIQNKELKESYFFLMRGTSVDEEEEGYPPLTVFFSVQDVKSHSPIMNLYDMHPKLIEVMFGINAAKHVESLRREWKHLEPTVQEEQEIYRHFIETHHLNSHPYHSLINLKIRNNEKLQ